MFSLLLTHITPLYFFVLMGYVAARYLKVDGRNIASIMFYMLFPIIVFDGARKTDISLSTLTMPLFIMAISSAMCLTYRAIGQRIWKGDVKIAGVLGLSVGTANSGYFGLPVAAALFDEQTIATYIVIIVGMLFFESTVGFYITARGEHTPKEAIKKLLRLPTLYTFVLGAAFNLLAITPSESYTLGIGYLRGAYVVCGMMMVGLGMGAVEKLVFGPRFMALALSARFVVWPLLMSSFVWLDRNYMSLFPEEAHKGFLLISIVPLAANSVAIASILKAHPEKVATTVLVSTLIALVYVPVMAGIFFG